MKNANIAESLAGGAKVKSNLDLMTMMAIMTIMAIMTMIMMGTVTMLNVKMYQVAVLGKILLVECEVFALSLQLAFAE